MSRKVSKKNLEKIQELLSQGHSVAEIAKTLQVSRPTVYANMKKVNSCVPLQVMADEGRAKAFIQKTLVDIAGNLQLLDETTKRVMREALTDFEVYKKNAKGEYVLIQFPNYNLVLDACARLEAQLIIAQKTFDSFYNTETFKDFCQIVLDEFNKVAPNAAKRILERLKEYRPDAWVIRGT